MTESPGSVIAELCRLATPGAIDETRVVALGGVPQVVSIRGRDRRNPIMIVVHGGPGTPLSATSWMWQRPLEEYFTVVQYDQRGAGRSFQHDDSAALRGALSLDHCARDAVELAELIKGEFEVEQVCLVGHSWGSAVAARAVLLRPDLFAAYLGVCQVVSGVLGEEASWSWVRAEAERRDDRTALAELAGIAPYPRPFEVSKLIIQRRWVERFGGVAAGRADGPYFTNGDLAAPDYSDADRASSRAGRAFLADHLLPQFIDLDFTQVHEFPIPIIQFLGRHDQVTPTGPVIDWLNRLEAPAKIVTWFEDSAHLPMYEQPGRFLVAVLQHLLPYAPGPSPR
ncbi:alpha/beta fold hydrolase [Microlunatus speluncae]|uniref:alpha/beta fold hydrolase n=1 Tax=Microlunatus speluncae TaxID=2594267 RepID=UPI00126652F8|nr:alpha/beta hydrolase [Microlunatus speluncae]